METLKDKKLAGAKPPASTQQYIDIAAIRDDVVILKNGTLRSVLLASSINFALKDEDEQDAVVSGYVNFLNSLEWPIQIIIQSRPLNVDGYLKELESMVDQQTNELLRIQTSEYIGFIRELIDIGQIMSKRFYVVVPYNPMTSKEHPSFGAKLKQTISPTSIVRLQRWQFDHYKHELFKRVDYVRTGLLGLGVDSTPLDTQSLIELFYNSYNPTIASQEKLKSIAELRVENPPAFAESNK